MSRKKGDAIFTNWDSPKRKKSTKAKALPIPFFLKNDEKTSMNPTGLSFFIASDDSYLGVTKKLAIVKAYINNAATIMVIDQAFVLSP